MAVRVFSAIQECSKTVLNVADRWFVQSPTKELLVPILN